MREKAPFLGSEPVAVGEHQHWIGNGPTVRKSLLSSLVRGMVNCNRFFWSRRRPIIISFPYAGPQSSTARAYRGAPTAAIAFSLPDVSTPLDSAVGVVLQTPNCLHVAIAVGDGSHAVPKDEATRALRSA
jgi:hypothetical protein